MVVSVNLLTLIQGVCTIIRCRGKYDITFFPPGEGGNQTSPFKGWNQPELIGSAAGIWFDVSVGQCSLDSFIMEK